MGATYYLAVQIDLQSACPLGGFPVPMRATNTLRVRRAPAWANPRIAFGGGRPMPVVAGAVYPQLDPGGEINVYWTPTEGEVPSLESSIELELFAGDVSALPLIGATVPVGVPGGYAGEIQNSAGPLVAAESPVEEVLLVASASNPYAVLVGYQNTGAIFPLEAGASLTLRVNDLRNIAVDVSASDTLYYIAPQRSYL